MPPHVYVADAGKNAYIPTMARSYKTARLDDQTWKVIAELSEHLRVSQIQVLRDATEMYRRRVFFDEAKKAFRELRKDQKTYAAYKEGSSEQSVGLEG